MEQFICCHHRLNSWPFFSLLSNLYPYLLVSQPIIVKSNNLRIKWLCINPCVWLILLNSMEYGICNCHRMLLQLSYSFKVSIPYIYLIKFSLSSQRNQKLRVSKRNMNKIYIVFLKMKYLLFSYNYKSRMGNQIRKWKTDQPIFLSNSDKKGLNAFNLANKILI